MAEVKLNGRNLGILWQPPFRADISGMAKAGDNDLEIRVVNLWPNRMIGDAQLPSDTPRRHCRGLPQWLLDRQPKPVRAHHLRHV